MVKSCVLNFPFQTGILVGWVYSETFTFNIFTKPVCCARDLYSDRALVIAPRCYMACFVILCLGNRADYDISMLPLHIQWQLPKKYGPLKASLFLMPLFDECVEGSSCER